MVVHKHQWSHSIHMQVFIQGEGNVLVANAMTHKVKGAHVIQGRRGSECPFAPLLNETLHGMS